MWEAGIFVGCIMVKKQTIEMGELIDVGSENCSPKLDLLSTF